MRDDERQRVYRMHADICKTFANPRRLAIVEALADGEVGVTDLARRVGATKANVSQHLAVMRAVGVVQVRAEGNRCFYRLASAKITQACRLMREVLFEQMAVGARLARELRPAASRPRGGGGAR